MIFTCNFANWRKIPLKVFPISIARHAPAGWAGGSYDLLYPTESLLRQYKEGMLTDSKYTELYKKFVLSQLDPAKVVNDIYDMADISYSGVVLLCYEHSDKFCHRHLVSMWLKSHGFSAAEFTIKVPIKNPLGLLRKYHD